MSLNTFNKFGVPLEDGTRNGMLQPKLSYRFRVSFEGFGDGTGLRELTQNVQKVGRPKVNFNEIPVHSYNSVAYIHGKHEWDTIEIEFRDDITNKVVATIARQVQKQINFFEQTAAVAGASYKFNMKIESLDGSDPEPLEVWELGGCYLADYTSPEGSYEAGTEFNKVSITVRYDNAAQLKGPNDLAGETAGDIFTDVATTISSSLGI